jgi:predicted acylesterase/phospholipase RssA
VKSGGRVLCDGGYTNNLPLDPIFATELARDLLCIASDLFSPRAPRQTIANNRREVCVAFSQTVPSTSKSLLDCFANLRRN